MSGAAETLKAALAKSSLTLEQLVALPAREALRLPLIGLKVLAEARRQASRRGGARAGSGVKPTDGATNLVQIGLRIRADQKPKLAQLGGSVWVRQAIDEASARRAAESMIDECDESLRGMLGVDINEEDGFE